MSDSTRGRVPIADVRVEDRHRRDLGDLSELRESIQHVGLLHPIVVTTDLLLVAGQRRLEACRQLGMTEVPASVVTGMDEASDLLVAERDENTCRKPMTASELYALGKALEELERPKAKARQEAQDFGRNSGSTDPKLGPTGRTYEVVAPAVDMSAPQWKRLKHIGDRAAEGDEVAAKTLEDIDQGKTTITGGYRTVRNEHPTSDLGNVGDKRSVPKKKGPETQLRQMAAKVKELGGLARMIDLDGLNGEEADSIAADLGEGLSALTTLKNQLRKVNQ